MIVHTIYILIDPRTAAVRYVGQTSAEPHIRLSQHIRHARKGHNHHRCCWIRQLLAEGHRPVLIVVERTSSYKERERFWVTHYRNAGCPMTNATHGGETPPTLSEAFMANARRLRNSFQGRKHTPESIARMSAAQKGKKHGPPSPECRAAMSAHRKGKPLPEKAREARHELQKEHPSGATLTVDEVRAIREVWMSGGITLQKLADLYRVREKAVWEIVHWKTWKYIDPDSPKPVSIRKLTRADVLAIRAQYAVGDTSSMKLGKEYGVDPQTIMNIVTFKSWKHVA